MSKHKERALGVVGLVLAGAVPALVWHELLGQLLASFSLRVGYVVTGLSGFMLIALGLLVSLPVVLSIGLNPDSRLYPRSRGALAGWGISLYLMGLFLVAQIGAIAANI
jgi:hypothetical protein